MTAHSPGSTAAPRVWVGNDVVDLEHPRCRTRPSPDRLPDRILTAREREWLEARPRAAPPERRLWALWAGKETAFKIVSKVLGSPPVFRHRSFEMEFRETHEGEGFFHLEGVGRWRESPRGEEIEVRLDGIATDQFVHLAGWGPVTPALARPILEVGVEGWGDSEEAADEPSVSQGELLGVHGPLSRRARKLARTRLAGHLRVYRGGDPSHQPRIEILTSGERPGRTPPRIVIDGTHRPEMDLSLSHHGRYVGWALLLPTPAPAPPSQRRGR